MGNLNGDAGDRRQVRRGNEKKVNISRAMPCCARMNVEDKAVEYGRVQGGAEGKVGERGEWMDEKFDREAKST